MNASLGCFACPSQLLFATRSRAIPTRSSSSLRATSRSARLAGEPIPAITRCNLICVAASTPDDSLASFSTTVTAHVDLAAPEWASRAPGSYDDRFVDRFREGVDELEHWRSNNSWQATNAQARSGASIATDSPGGNYQKTRQHLRLAEPVKLRGRAVVSSLLDASLAASWMGLRWVEASRRRLDRVGRWTSRPVGSSSTSKRT